MTTSRIPPLLLDFRALFESAPGCYWVLLPDFTMFVHLKQHRLEQHKTTEQLLTHTGQMAMEILMRTQELHNANQQLRDNQIFKEKVRPFTLLWISVLFWTKPLKIARIAAGAILRALNYSIIPCTLSNPTTLSTVSLWN